eukprot:1011016-Amphidinium_carterae.1
MVDIVIARAATRSERVLTEPSAELTLRPWRPRFRIRGKRPRDQIETDTTMRDRDGRGRLSRRRTNLDEFQMTRDRLLLQVQQLPDADEGLVPWPPPGDQSRRYSMFNQPFLRWYQRKPEHIVPCVRFLRGLAPSTGTLYWQCQSFHTLRNHLYKEDFLRHHSQ